MNKELYLEIFGTCVIVYAVWRLAWVRVEKNSGRKASGAIAWLLIAGVIGARFYLSEMHTNYTAFSLPRDLGVGFMWAALRLWYNKIPAKGWFFFGAALLATGALGINYLVPSTGTESESANEATDGAEESGGQVELLVELGPDDNIDEIKPILEKFDAVWERAFPNVDLKEDEDLAQVYIVRCASGVVEELTKALQGDSENVDHVERNISISIIQPLDGKEPAKGPVPSVANDPKIARQWAMRYSKGFEALLLLRTTRPKKLATVAILDTGVDATHEDIKGVFKESPDSTDRQGHGSHCAGIAGAYTNNGLGMASLNWQGGFVRITSYAALPMKGGGGTAETVAQAIIDAAEDGADVISLSLGGNNSRSGPPRVTRSAIVYALSLGSIIVVAAGNENTDAARKTPASIDGVITVAAVDQQGRKAKFSNTNNTLALPIAAPGVDILSLKPGGGYIYYSGTSMATPFVAGLLGVMVSLKPELRAYEAYQILKKTGIQGPDANRVGKTVNAEAAIRAVMD